MFSVVKNLFSKRIANEKIIHLGAYVSDYWKEVLSCSVKGDCEYSQFKRDYLLVQLCILNKGDDIIQVVFNEIKFKEIVTSLVKKTFYSKEYPYLSRDECHKLLRDVFLNDEYNKLIYSHYELVLSEIRSKSIPTVYKIKSSIIHDIYSANVHDKWVDLN